MANKIKGPLFTIVSPVFDQVRVMLLDPEVKYPLLLSANFLITTNQPLVANSGDKTSPTSPLLPGPLVIYVTRE